MRIFSLWKLVVATTILMGLSFSAFADEQIPQDLGRCSHTIESNCYPGQGPGLTPASLSESVPEPGVFWLVGAGLAGIYLARQRGK